MFSNENVIKASRDFVCVRIDSYESEENQKIVCSHLDGRFENTAFCVFAPDGKTRLTRSGRGPRQAVSANPGDFVDKLQSIKAKYSPKSDPSGAPLPDYNSFKLALNIAAADQRLLVLVAAPKEQLEETEQRLRPLAWKSNVQGRFHFDLDETDAWKAPLSRPADAKSGIYIVAPGTFGLEGSVISQLELNAKPTEILNALAIANAGNAKSTEKKNYSDHVKKGREKGKSILMGVPFGEDRDGNGEIDRRAGGRRGRE